MEYRTRQQLQGLAAIADAPALALSRRERLERWADLLARDPDRRLRSLHDIEFRPAAERLALRADGSALTVAFDGLEAGVGGGPISSLLGGASGSVGADIAVGFDTSNGLTLSGSAGKRVVLPAHTEAGPLALNEIAIELPGGDAVEIGSTINADLGVIKAQLADIDGHQVNVPCTSFSGLSEEMTMT